MLPLHQQPQARQASPSPQVSRYVVQSSDVLQEPKICVYKEQSDTVLWYKDRYLSDDEIVENVVENLTSTICWTIHRPKRGWYVRIRAPSFPPGGFISLNTLPTSRSSSFHVDGALAFSCRTNAPNAPSSRLSRPAPSHITTSEASKDTTSSASESTVIHSYPPSPPNASLTLQPPSPRSIHAKLSDLSLLGSEQFRRPSVHVAQFILAPHTVSRSTQFESMSFIGRALTAFRTYKPSHSSSFTLSPIPSALHPESSLRAAPNSVPSPESHDPPAIAEPLRPAPLPLLTFHDRTALWTFHSTMGLLEFNDDLEREMGVDKSFWITVALAYMEFLSDREGYLAAANG